ncbi:MAG: hypothetical protein F4X63_02710 [Nitrospira sp. SB0662_bin_26]|nr:hypothetical protein [Nitrospira sp. SB0662_bin_26]
MWRPLLVNAEPDPFSFAILTEHVAGGLAVSGNGHWNGKKIINHYPDISVFFNQAGRDPASNDQMPGNAGDQRRPLLRRSHSGVRPARKLHIA